MKRLLGFIIIFTVISFFYFGCGGGGGSSTPTVPTVVDTDLTVPQDLKVVKTGKEVLVEWKYDSSVEIEGFLVQRYYPDLGVSEDFAKVMVDPNEEAVVSTASLSDYFKVFFVKDTTSLPNSKICYRLAALNKTSSSLFTKYECTPYPEICDNDVDDDLDGFVDMDDSDCIVPEPVPEPVPVDEICNDWVDNDLDGFIDCEDSDCFYDTNCYVEPEPEPEPEPVPVDEVCNDNIDNDLDGYVDCEDFDCVNSEFCIVPEPVLNYGALQFSSNNYVVNEAAGEVLITINRISGSDGEVSVEWRTLTFDGFGDADWSNDYGTFLWEVVTFADGEISKTLPIAIYDDSLVENDETFSILLQNPTNGALLIDPTIAVVTIKDNDVYVPPVPDPDPNPVPDDLGPLKAFPWAEGFGTDTPGGRGGQIIKVTNLNDSGPGSLRAAIATNGPRIVVFEVSGVIRLTSEINIDNPFITIAGQTAPAPGITIRDRNIATRTHDIVIQHIRFRPGDTPSGLSYEEEERDCIKINDYYRIDTINNIVIDHCSLQWSIDENIGGYGYSDHKPSNVTISNCIVSEGLQGPPGVALQGSGDSYGVLIGDYCQKWTVINNLMSSNKERTPLFKGGTSGVVVNNLIYNTYWGTWIQFADDLNHGPIYATAIGNVDKYGPISRLNTPVYVNPNVRSLQLYYEDNINIGYSGGVLNGDAGINPFVSFKPIWVDVNVIPSSQVENYVLQNAGARPAERFGVNGDPVDERLVNEVTNYTGSIKSSVLEAGGFPVVPQNYRVFNIPVNPNGDDNGNGYTNIEEILYQMALEVEK